MVFVANAVVFGFTWAPLGLLWFPLVHFGLLWLIWVDMGNLAGFGTHMYTYILIDIHPDICPISRDYIGSNKNIINKLLRNLNGPLLTLILEASPGLEQPRVTASNTALIPGVVVCTAVAPSAGTAGSCLQANGTTAPYRMAAVTECTGADDSGLSAAVWHFYGDR